MNIDLAYKVSLVDWFTLGSVMQSTGHDKKCFLIVFWGNYCAYLDKKKSFSVEEKEIDSKWHVFDDKLYEIFVYFTLLLCYATGPTLLLRASVRMFSRPLFTFFPADTFTMALFLQFPVVLFCN